MRGAPVVRLDARAHVHVVTRVYVASARSANDVTQMLHPIHLVLTVMRLYEHFGAPIFIFLWTQLSTLIQHTHALLSLWFRSIAGGVSANPHNAENAFVTQMSTLHSPARSSSPADPRPHTSGTAFSPDASHHGGRAQQARRGT